MWVTTNENERIQGRGGLMLYFFYMPGIFFLLSPSFFFHNRLCTVHPSI